MGRNDLPHPVSDEEWALRCELAAAYRLFHKFGWDEVIYGHLTCRVPNGADDADVENAHFLINPLGLRYDEICASSLVTIDIKGNYINRGSTGWDINHAGYVIHSCIHECRHDMKCVMHCHTIEGSAVSSMKFGLLPISQLSHVAMSAGVSYHDYEGLAVSEGEKPRLKADLGPDNKLFILRNHGLLTGGATIAEAFFWMYYAVHACKIQVAALSAGIENVSYASEEVANQFKVGLQTFTKTGVGADMFNALKRGLPKDYENYETTMAAHGTLDENIQLTRVFRTLTIEIPEKRLTRKLLSLEAKMTELRANGSDANALEMKRLDAKWAATQSERQKLREVAQQDYASLFARAIERTALFEVYEKLGYPKTMSEVEDLIWEVNDGLNGAISWDEYERSFERCKADKSCLEPSDLFYLTCFLMYDRDVSGKVSMDDAMHILFLKHGNNMEDEMTALFGKSHSDDYVSALPFRTFADAIDKRRSEIIDHSGLTNRLPGKKGAWKGYQQ